MHEMSAKLKWNEINEERRGKCEAKDDDDSFAILAFPSSS